MEDQKFIYYLHTKTYCTSNNQNHKEKKKKEKEKREEKEKILYWRLTCSLYRINLLEIDLFSSSGYVWMDMTNSA